MRFYHIVLWYSLLNFVTSIEYCPSGTLVIVKGLKQTDEDAATCAHNRVRQSLADGRVAGQPRAKFMKTMVYDQLLAHKATPVSKQCTNNPIDVKDRRWPCVGQNIYYTCSDRFDPNQYWDEAVDFWWSEKQYFAYPNVRVRNLDVSHYRQLAWANTDTFGCDFYLFINSDDPEHPFCKLYTCNYGQCANNPGFSDLAPYEIA
ncbi:venom allergen 5-like [Atheta coriaria]|uniref:venom allergen 5-like n=1 Tax=Dalotia coriaria TaxID=877792 RepID=UPI0031F399F1